MPTIFIILIAIVALIIIALVIILVRSVSGGNKDKPDIETSISQSPITPKQMKQLKQPIDRVKDFLNQDMESQGYEDAQSNSDSGFKQQKVLELKEQGRQECISAISKYEDKIADLDANITIYTNAVLFDTVEKLKAQKVKYQKDIKRIEQMQTELSNDNLKVYASYGRGFAKWQKAIAEGLIGTEGTGPENWN